MFSALAGRRFLLKKMPKQNYGFEKRKRELDKKKKKEEKRLAKLERRTTPAEAGTEVAGEAAE